MKTTKGITVVVISALIIALGLLGYEVKNLRTEINNLSLNQTPSVKTTVVRTTRQARPNKFTSVKNNFKTTNTPLDPFSEFQNIHSQMNRLMQNIVDEGLMDTTFLLKNNFAVDTDINEEDGKYIVNIDIPGMKKEDINVEIKNNGLIISGKRVNEKSESNEKKNYYRRERSFGSFYRSLVLPEDADADHISVEYKKGVLTITIPKKEKADKKEEKTKKLDVK